MSQNRWNEPSVISFLIDSVESYSKYRSVNTGSKQHISNNEMANFRHRFEAKEYNLRVSEPKDFLLDTIDPSSFGLPRNSGSTFQYVIGFACGKHLTVLRSNAIVDTKRDFDKFHKFFKDVKAEHTSQGLSFEYLLLTGVDYEREQTFTFAGDHRMIASVGYPSRVPPNATAIADAEQTVAPGPVIVHRDTSVTGGQLVQIRTAGNDRAQEEDTTTGALQGSVTGTTLGSTLDAAIALENQFATLRIEDIVPPNESVNEEFVEEQPEDGILKINSPYVSIDEVLSRPRLVIANGDGCLDDPDYRCVLCRKSDAYEHGIECRASSVVPIKGNNTLFEQTAVRDDQGADVSALVTYMLNKHIGQRYLIYKDSEIAALSERSLSGPTCCRRCPLVANRLNLVGDPLVRLPSGMNVYSRRGKHFRMHRYAYELRPG
jgi:hypothetical protein